MSPLVATAERPRWSPQNHKWQYCLHQVLVPRCQMLSALIGRSNNVGARPQRFRIHLNKAEHSFLLVPSLPPFAHPLDLDFSLMTPVYSLCKSSYSPADAGFLTLKLFFLYLTSRVFLPRSPPTAHILLTCCWPEFCHIVSHLVKHPLYTLTHTLSCTVC